jgi:hypothetical protein
MTETGTAMLYIIDRQGDEHIIELRRVTYAQALREASSVVTDPQYVSVDVDFMPHVTPVAQTRVA